MIDVGGDKVVFIVASNGHLLERVSEALSVLQMSLGRRPMKVFTKMLQHDFLLPCVRDLSKRCRQNRAYLQAQLPEGMAVVEAAAGTVAWA